MHSFRVKSIYRTTLQPLCITLILLTLLAIFLTVVPVKAAEKGATSPTRSDQGDWRFSVAAYGWLTGINGDIYTSGIDTEVDVPFSEIFEDVDAGFMMYAEARWKKWFASFDGYWANLSDKAGDGLSRTKVIIDAEILEFKVGREIYHKYLQAGSPTDENERRRQAGLDLFIGTRYFSSEPSVEISSIDGNFEKYSISDERWDPVIGARYWYDLSPKWSFALKGDIGGFGIGNAAQFTWQAEGTLGYRFTQRFSLLVGYRVLSFDTVEGSGFDKNGVDLTQHGPLIGLGFNF